MHIYTHEFASMYRYMRVYMKYVHADVHLCIYINIQVEEG
jgi:hypothetical protein